MLFIVCGWSEGVNAVSLVKNQRNNVESTPRFAFNAIGDFIMVIVFVNCKLFLAFRFKKLCNGQI